MSSLFQSGHDALFGGECCCERAARVGAESDADLLKDFDDAFWPALRAMAIRLGTNPADHLAVFWSESRLSPRCVGVMPSSEPGAPPSGRCYAPGWVKNTVAAGLNMMTAVAMDSVGFPKASSFAERAKMYAELPPSEQLVYVERMHEKLIPYIRGAGLGMLYVANAFPGYLATAKSGGPDTPLAKQGTPPYDGNAGADREKKGYLTLRDLERIASNAKNDPKYQAAVRRLGSASMSPPTPGSPSAPGAPGTPPSTSGSGWRAAAFIGTGLAAIGAVVWLIRKG